MPAFTLLTLVAMSAAQPPAADQLAAKVIEIREVRVREVAPRDPDKFVMSGDKPGLSIKLQVTLPEGAVLTELAEPSSISAKDSSWADLTDIEPGFSGGKEFFGQMFSGDREKGEISIRLAPAARAANSFSLSLRADATIATGTENITLPVSEKWTNLDEAKFGTFKGKPGEFRVKTGDDFAVEFRPEDLQSVIAEVAVQGEPGSEPVAANTRMWGMGEVNYSFEGVPANPTGLIVTVRTGVRKLPLVVELEDQALP
jgi:hypothetical protein